MDQSDLFLLIMQHVNIENLSGDGWELEERKSSCVPPSSEKEGYIVFQVVTESLGKIF